jgi:hypothetical protein
LHALRENKLASRIWVERDGAEALEVIFRTDGMRPAGAINPRSFCSS